MPRKKTADQKWYLTKGELYNTQWKEKLAQPQANYQKQKINNNFEHKKSMLLQAHQKNQTEFQKRFEIKLQELEKWYQEKMEDYDWDLNNFQDTLQKNVTKFETTGRQKINCHFDKKIYHQQLMTQTQELNNTIQITTDELVKKDLVHQKHQLPFTIVAENNLSYQPWQVNLYEKQQHLKNNLKTTFNNYYKNLHNLKYLTWKDFIKFKLFGIPFYLYILMLAATLVAIYTKTLPAEAMGAMAVLFVIAIIGGEFFNRLPIWKTFVGGGTMGVFFLGAFLGTFNAFPPEIVSAVKAWFSKGGFLNLYINVLIVGSILTIPRQLILRSFGGFMVLLISGTGLAVLFGWGFGNLMGLPNHQTVLQIMLPLLSDGNGGGVQPLSAMSQSYGYMPQGDYMSFALAVSSVSNIFVIIIAAILTASLSKSPTLSGNGKLVKKEVHIRDEKIDPSHRSIAAGLALCVVIYVFCKFIEVEIKKSSGVEINAFAWAVVISLLINLLNILPKELKAGCNVLNKFFSKQFTWFLMAGVGLCMTDLNKFASLFTHWEYIILILLMDVALILGPMLLANLIKFYTLESMIAAGCCMGAQGEAGSLAVLGAAKRMDLLPYSQITCRIGGGIVLIVAAPIFLVFTQAEITG
ncbi:2-hydroxycarboxylate transporter family protein [Spiroplasma eriocheiris]|nr:2-hydroxycarboxylate transporter family protein [Spiroplasma eriocheiris]